MRYVIKSRQDYSERIGGSWGSVVVFDPGRVETFLLKGGGRKVIVQNDDKSPLTGELDLDQWRVWKEENNPL